MTAMRAVDRRQLLGLAAGLGASGLLPAWAKAASSKTPDVLSGEDIRLTIGHASVTIDGKPGHAIAVNGTVPGPLIRLKEGQHVRLSVTNALSEDTSIHWHGLLVPFQFDGVPGVSFPGIKPGETFVYDFKVRQSGTYWYHSHSGMQEQEGVYGPIIIEPAAPDPVAYDREHVVVLSDYSFMHPHVMMRKLKAQAGYFNDQKQTVAGLLAGRDQSLKDRVAWAKMRMDPTDILDVTGSAYTFLINGHGPGDNWTGLFTPGERVRLRFVNAGGMTIFNVRIPGLSMSVVSADGQNVQPVSVEEFQIAPAETYDVIVQPTQDRAFTLVAEAADRSGLARATLAPRLGMSAPGPAAARPAARDDEGHGHGHGPRRHGPRHVRHEHGHARPRQCAADRQDGAGRPDDRADAHRSPGRPAAGAGGCRPQGAGLCRSRLAGRQSRHPPARPDGRDPPDRQHGAVHVGVRRRGFRAAEEAHRLPARRAGASGADQRLDDGPSRSTCTATSSRS
jgi:CopA family copper-resistance protein